MQTLYGVRPSKAQPRLPLYLLVAALAPSALAGCADDPHLRTTTAVTDPCAVAPGQIPRADCASSGVTDESAGTASCVLARACGDAHTCFPLARNQGRTAMDFRVRQLSVVAPQALRGGPVQAALVQDRVDLDRRQCGEDGTGLWNWLLRVDRATSTLTTGGAPPADPIAQGYCFAHFATNKGTSVYDARAPITWNGTAFTTTVPMDVRLPVFHTNDPHSAQVLMIHDALFEDVSLASEDCIGAFNERALDSTCTTTNGRAKWTSGGALAGYMTLEEADEVALPDLDESLCVVLLGGGARDDATHRCTRDANGSLPALGDYCSLTKSPGGCRDSVWFAATFAASAVKIHDGTGVPACSGAQM